MVKRIFILFFIVILGGCSIIKDDTIINNSNTNEFEGLEQEKVDSNTNNIEDIVPIQMDSNIIFAKPVIYLYPEEEITIKVKLDYKGELLFTYPKYDEGWEVLAKPNGDLISLKDGREYSYLFWEGDGASYEITEGFVVSGSETVPFLQERLEYLGLIPREYNEFIVYWLPLMEKNNYNLIYFVGEEYVEDAQLIIDPKPDSIQRIFMVFKGLDDKIEIPEQALQPFERHGFSVVEWGGAEIK
ncbi:hypothetical protein EDC18_10488 [Natranaerovirga pectinivora]|uniref:Uncharacterized protein n=1 Tax=Natranaerovirga pectinivora TaxID=682400 RepID=A0A4R3MQU8_9FIRM|nr:hypothetical protein [Natranaerovirga pectinivora]TCT14938.1 hypothetical protein EDC18_10488 [Natranaerovirga pectinivora]